MKSLKQLLLVGALITTLPLLLVHPVQAKHASLSTDLTGATLPAKVDNRSKYLHPRFSQLGRECASAVGVSYVFGYEINAARDRDGSIMENMYPYSYTHSLLINDTSSLPLGTYKMLFDAWQIIKENGVPSANFTNGFTGLTNGKWAKDYNAWYEGMKNRISGWDTLKVKTEADLQKVKQWIYNHGNGSSVGGIAAVFIASLGEKIDTLKPGTPEAGSIVLRDLLNSHTSDHTVTVAGYNDSIKYDFNGDGTFTTTVDINKDGKVDLQDWEIGAFILLNTWWSDWGSVEHMAYAPYRIFAKQDSTDHRYPDFKMYTIDVVKEYTPRVTIKCKINHNVRNLLRIVPGISPDTAATSPTKTIEYAKLFNYNGAPYPMEGQSMGYTIEFGLDVSSLADAFSASGNCRYFLQVTSKGGAGSIDSFTVIDYRNTPAKYYPCSKSNVTITKNTTTTLSVMVPAPATNEMAPHPDRFAATVMIDRVANVNKPLTIRCAVHAAEITLNICSFSGRVLHTQTAPVSSLFPLTTFNWNCRLTSGIPVAAGGYVAVVNVKDNNGTTIRHSQPFCITK